MSGAWGGKRQGAGRRSGSQDRNAARLGKVSAFALVKPGQPLPLPVMLEAMTFYYERAHFETNENGTFKLDAKQKRIPRQALDEKYLEKSVEHAERCARFCHPMLSTHAIVNPGAGIGAPGSGVKVVFYIPDNGRIVHDVTPKLPAPAEPAGTGNAGR